MLKEQAQRNAVARVSAPAKAAVRAHAAGKGLARGGRGFFRNVAGPFARAGRSLWLEVTGLFFGLFALFFAQNVFRLRGYYLRGDQHEHFLFYCVLLIIFGYFSVTSFARARRPAGSGKR